MTYRRADAPPASRERVVVRSYPLAVDAELARALLEAEGVEARVVEGASYNPALGSATGAHVEVAARDGDRAEALLRREERRARRIDLEGGGGHADDEADAELARCPRCEEPCEPGPSSERTFGRLRCDRCGHRFSADERVRGPATRLADDAPRPVFRLRRDEAPTGAFVGLTLGLVGGLAASSVLGPLGLVLAPAGLVLGALGGRRVGGDVCSLPSCRAPLPPGVTTCRACGGTVAGRVGSTEEHFAEAAAVRRELASLEARAPRPDPDTRA